MILPAHVAAARGEIDPIPAWLVDELHAFFWRLRRPWGASVQETATVCALLFFVLGAAGLARRPDGLVACVAALHVIALMVSVVLLVSMDRYRYALIAPLTPFAALGLLTLLGADHDPSAGGAADETAPVRAGSRVRALVVALLVAALLFTSMYALPAPLKPTSG